VILFERISSINCRRSQNTVLAVLIDRIHYLSLGPYVHHWCLSSSGKILAARDIDGFSMLKSDSFMALVQEICWVLIQSYGSWIDRLFFPGFQIFHESKAIEILRVV
jgi:hypothetical protein